MNNSIENIDEYETTLKSLYSILIEKKLFIFILTISLSLLTTIYFISLPNPTPRHEAKTSFIEPSRTSLLKLKGLGITDYSAKEIFYRFKTQINSKDIQKKILKDSNLIAKNISAVEADELYNNFINQIQFTVAADNEAFKDPDTISIKGKNPIVLTTYLSKLTSEVSKLVITEILNANNQDNLNIIENNILNNEQRIKELNFQIDSARVKAEQARLYKTLRIKESDNQKIRKINIEIAKVRFAEQQKKLNIIQQITDEIALAKSVGAIDENFQMIKSVASQNLTISVGDASSLPTWYLYGANALEERLRLLKERENNDRFIPELISLNNQLFEIENNPQLETLENRVNDDFLIDTLPGLMNELRTVKNNLKAVKNQAIYDLFELTDDKIIKLDINAMEMSSKPIVADITSSPINIRLIAFLAFFVSLLFSIIISLLIRAIKI